MPIYRLAKELVFPSPEDAGPEGLLAVGGDLSLKRLLLAYHLGIFPWYDNGSPILWWSPDPRCVLEPRQLQISQSLSKVIKKERFRITLDQEFDRVIRGCAEARRPGGEGTWIVEEMVRAYIRLHHAGFAHSVESWCEGELVGGLYGVSLGRVFFGESMFYRMENASKVALVYLVRLLEQWRFDLIDCQVTTANLLRFGAREIPRRRFLQLLDKSLRHETRPGPWVFPDHFQALHAGAHVS